MHIQSVDQVKAIKTLKRKITDLDRSKIEEEKKAVRAGYDMDIIPSDLATYGSEAKKLLQDLQSRNIPAAGTAMGGCESNPSSAFSFCLALHGADLHIRSGAWSAQHGNCSSWRGCAYYLFPAEWCDFAGYSFFD